jgi:hypothetical protein
MGEASKDEKEEKFIPVGPGADEQPEEPKDKAEPEDKRLAQEDDEPEGDEKPTERKRESSKERRERAKKAHARDRTELEFLRKRNEDLEKRQMAIEARQAKSETSAIDQRITQVATQVANAGRVMADALKKPNGAGADEFEEAQKIRDELRDQLAELKATKKLHQERTAPVAREEPDTAKPDPRVIRNAREWASKNPWFDFNGEDEDSQIVRAIDTALSQAGFDPTDEEYWDELTSRVKHRLPERFKKGVKARPRDEDDDTDDDEDEREVRSSGPKFSSGGRERPLKKGEVYVSAERKQAMKEYGVWDDPVARNRMLKKYAQWDAEVTASKSR